MTRLRYTTKSDRILESKPIVIEGLIVIVLLDLQEKMFTIHNLDDHEILKTGKGKDLAELKKNAKEKLIEMGAVFRSELRNRNKEIC